MGSRIRETCRFVLMGLVATASGPAAGSPSTARSHLAVTAQVVAVTRIEGIRQPDIVNISSDDTARGYVTARATLTVRSNAPAGYVLTLWPRAPWFDSVRVVGAGTTAEIPGDGGSIAQPATESAVEEVVLELTFRLRDDLPDGAYAWPVEFAVTSL